MLFHYILEWKIAYKIMKNIKITYKILKNSNFKKKIQKKVKN